MAPEQGFSLRRSAALAVTLALHLALFAAMMIPVGPVERGAAASLREGFSAVRAGRAPSVEGGVPVDLAIPNDRTPARAGTTAAARPRRAVRTTRSGSARLPQPRVAPFPSADPLPATGGAPAGRPIPFLDGEGRALLPATLDDALPADAPGFRVPGDGSEDDVFDRRTAVEYAPTRFADAWRPSTTLGGEVYERLVRATTGIVRVPLNPKFDLVCGASIAGLGGACVIVKSSPPGIIVERPAPAPWERASRVQCREFRAALEATTDAAALARLVERLAALCSGPVDGSVNEEARRDAGLQGA